MQHMGRRGMQRMNNGGIAEAVARLFKMQPKTREQKRKMARFSNTLGEIPFY
jgi:hypothetical protein